MPQADRNEAYNYWVLDLPSPDPVGLFADGSNTAVIVKAGYLLRTANIHGATLELTGDLNCTVPVEIVGAPSSVKSLSFNGLSISTKCNDYGVLSGSLGYSTPDISLPRLVDLQWKYVDSLPEIKAGYDDSKWTTAGLTVTQNPNKLKTPTSLYGSDYGFNAGNLLIRGHFTANGAESTLFLRTQGGTA